MPDSTNPRIFMTIDEPKLFDAVAPGVNCFVCFDTNLYRTLEGKITTCPERNLSCSTQPNHAALRLKEAIEFCHDSSIFIGGKWFELARVLCGYSTFKPCPRKTIEDVFGWQYRQIALVIEGLRKSWKLPVGSRKNERENRGTGFWIITDPKDFLEWQRESRTAAITSLATGYALFRHNFATLAGQDSLPFEQQVNTELQEAIKSL